MKVITIDAARKRLKKITHEIHYTSCFKSKHFTSGLVVFHPVNISNQKQIAHSDKDVVCHVLKGTGRVRIRRRRIQLRPGMLCHIPKNTPHDFAAGRTGELLLFYSLVDS